MQLDLYTHCISRTGKASAPTSSGASVPTGNNKTNTERGEQRSQADNAVQILKDGGYLAEITAHAHRQALIFQEARLRLAQQGELSALELSGALHALQVLIENAIGKAKQLLKVAGVPVPVSAYEAFDLLFQQGSVDSLERDQWKKMIGLRSRVVHDYLNVDVRLIYQLLETEAYGFVIDFLRGAHVKYNAQ